MLLIVTLPPIGEQSIVVSMYVCVCVFVCPRRYLQNYTSDLPQIFLCMSVACSSSRSVVMLYVFPVFFDDVILVHKLRLLDVATRLRLQDSHAALGLARRNTHHRQQTFGTTSCSQGLLGRSGRVKHS